MPEVNEAIIEPMAKKIEEYNKFASTVEPIGPDSYLYAGLSVLARDLYYYLSSHPRSDAKWFQDMIPSVIEEERIYYKEQHSGSKEGFPYDDGENPNLNAVSNLPTGIVDTAAQGRIDISPLYNVTIVHEWPSFTGRILFRKFESKFKEVICGKGGPYEQLNKGLIDKATPVTAIVADVAKDGF
jgi:hypothetical protein